MHETLIVGLVAVIALGTIAQWAAWRLRIPTILVLIVVGFVAGPIAGAVEPDELLGDLTLPLVSLAAAVVLFEGGLSASLDEIRSVAAPVRRLVTVGVLLSWGLLSAAGYYLLGLGVHVALLLGAILVVTGPTVIGPLLRHVRPRGRVGSIIKLEGILNDPFGAVLAVLVFQAIRADRIEHAVGVVAFGVLKSIVAGVVPGLVCAGVLYVFLKKNLLPDFLRNTMSLALALSAYVIANHFMSESGLLAVTVMGIALASQKSVRIDAIEEFSAHLRTVLISALFIVLAARITLDQLASLPLRTVLFLAAVLLVVRPVMVWLSTIGAGLTWREKTLISGMAPRGIVAAAVSSVFGLRLAEAGVAGAEQLMPITFLVIVTTVAVYGLGAAPLARALGIRDPHPEGVLFVGAGPLARNLARVLKEQGLRVLLVDSDWSSVAQARSEGLPVEHGSALSEEALNRMNLEGIGKLFAMTRSDGLNTLAAVHFRKVFGEDGVFQVRPTGETAREKDKYARHLRGHFIAQGLRYQDLLERLYRGAQVKVTPLTESFDWPAWQERYAERAVPLVTIAGDEERVERTRMRVLTPETPPPAPGERLVSLVMPRATKRRTPRKAA